MAPTSIAFIDDHPILRESLVNLYSERPDYVVVGSGSCAADAVSIAAQHAPDVLIIDLLMPGNALEAIARIRMNSQSIVILAFTASDRTDHTIKALEAGANGYVLKGSTASELTDAIVNAMRGETFVTPSLAGKMIVEFRKPSALGTSQAHLTVREDQIVKLLLKGLSNKAIGTQLKISEKTVKHYMTLLMQKLDARSRLEVVIAIQKRAQTSAAGQETETETVN